MAALPKAAIDEVRRLADRIVGFFETHGRDEQYNHVTYPALKTLRRLNLQAQWIGPRAALGGWQLKMHAKEPMKSEKPKQELRSVVKLMARLEDTRQSADWPRWVYLVQCEDSCYYVGYTEKELSKRIQEHRDMTSPANWTVVHPVAGVVAAFPGTTSVGPTGGPDKVWGDEDWLTLLIARSSSEKYVRVRGGRWTSIDYEPDWPTEYSLEFIKGKLLNNKPPPTTEEERQIRLAKFRSEYGWGPESDTDDDEPSAVAMQTTPHAKAEAPQPTPAGEGEGSVGADDDDSGGDASTVHTNNAQSSEQPLSCHAAVITDAITTLMVSRDVDTQCRRYYIDFANEHVHGK
jgi:hypothetical protein